MNILVAVVNPPSLSAPGPSLATLQAELSALEGTETAVRSGSCAAAAGRDEKRRVPRTLLWKMGGYVPEVAAGDPRKAEAVIENADVSDPPPPPHA